MNTSLNSRKHLNQKRNQKPKRNQRKEGNKMTIDQPDEINEKLLGIERITVSKEEMKIIYPDGESRENIGRLIDFDLFIQSCAEKVGSEMTSTIINHYFELFEDRKKEKNDKK